MGPIVKLERIVALLMMVASPGPSNPPPVSNKNDGPSTNAIITVVCAVLSWTFFPVIAAIVGIIVGRGELKAIERGESPASGELLTKIAFWACVANLLLTIFGTCASIALVFAIYAGLLAGVGGLAFFTELANSIPQ